MPEISQPPLPPSVTSQGGPGPGPNGPGSGMQRWAQRRMASPPAATPQQSPQDFDGIAFANAKLDQVAKDLTEIAKVLAVAKPEALEVLKRMAQMGSTLQGMIQESTAAQQQGAPASGLAPEEPGGSAAMATT